MYLVKTPSIAKSIFSNTLWSVENTEKIYLTFDDGPIPEVTPFVLDVLNEFNIKATFFCVGENVIKHPEIYARLQAEGHIVGNHTYNHLNAWKVSNGEYLDNIEKMEATVTTPFFRPPYGKLTPRLAKQINKKYKIVFWDVLSGDFDPSISSAQCYRNVIEHTTNGSIIVFHDSQKAYGKLKDILRKTIIDLQGKGFQFDVLNDGLI